jgi:hypothetical protein
VLDPEALAYIDGLMCCWGRVCSSSSVGCRERLGVGVIDVTGVDEIEFIDHGEP